MRVTQNGDDIRVTLLKVATRLKIKHIEFKFIHFDSKL